MTPLSIRTIREIGVRQLFWFGWYQLALRLGVYKRRCPAVPWDARTLEYWLKSGIPQGTTEFLERRAREGPDFFFSSWRSLSSQLHSVVGSDAEVVISEADAIGEGVFRVFGMMTAYTRFPPDWGSYLSLADHQGRPPEPLNRHWSTYRLEDLQGDVKLIWELGRFTWVYPLVRAYALSGDARYYQTFQLLLDSWVRANPPNCGVHWYSAQEVAIRLMALVFAWFGFQDQAVEDPQKFGTTAAVIAAHADRIPATLSYAQAQNNNHLLVEAVGLYTAGLLFPEFRLAEKWKELGRKWTIFSLDEQVFPDGGYIQHSTNYHRLALEAGLWAARLAEINGEPLPERSQSALGRMMSLIDAISDSETGRTLNLGPNDGAHLLPLSTCEYPDFRPVIQATSRLLDSTPSYSPGPWDEMSVWLGLGAQGTPLEGGQVEHFPQAGLSLMRGHTSHGVLRAVRFSNRPGHSDQTHFDLWKVDWNILRDPGTYLYNGRPPWENPFSPARFHNSVIIDEMEPMVRAGRFLWLNWSEATVLGRWRSEGGAIEAVAIQHDAYQPQGIQHIRMVIRAGEDYWAVHDKLLGSGEHEVRVAWNLMADSWELNENRIVLRQNGYRGWLECKGPNLRSGVYSGGIFIGGVDTDPDHALLGWYSPTYAMKESGLIWIAVARVTLPAVFSTEIAFEQPTQEINVTWAEDDSARLAIERVVFDGEEVSFDHANTADPPGFHDDR